VFDFGKNLAGRARLHVAGPAGTRVQVRYGELLYPDGTLNPMTAVCGQIKDYPAPEGSERPATAEQKDVYILRGEGVETWSPRFTFHAFRYVEVTGWPGEPGPDSIVAERLHTGVETSGTFACSQPLFNAIQEVTRNTFLGNLHGVQSDCPGREKFQYGGDIVATADAFLYNFDMRAQYAKTARDHADAQRDNAGFTETAPFVGIYDASLGGESGPIGWGTAHPLLVDHLYRWYGNRALVVEQYPRVKRWADFLAARAADGILDNGLGDHETIAPKDTAVSGTAFYIYNMHMASNLARIAGDEQGALRFDALRAEASAAFEQRLYNPETGLFGNGTQASQAFGLALGLPAVDQEKAVAALLADIAAHGDHLTTGIFGTKYLLDVLSALGHGDSAAAIAAQRDMPSWGYMIDQGATTLWEHWAGSDNTFSQNHPMFGSVSAWFFSRILGLRPAPDAVGFDRVIVQPCIESGLEWARGEYRSVRGPVRVSWENREGQFRLDLDLPPGVVAEVWLPGNDPAAVLEGDEAAGEAPGVCVAGVHGGYTILHAESGAYRFRVAG
jgi:alpha-L-rhamnosidase